MDISENVDLFGEQTKSKSESPPRKKLGKRNVVSYSEQVFVDLNELLKDPVLRDLMPKKVRGRKNRMVLWCVQELIKIVNNRGINAQQSVISFNSPETDAFCNAVTQLKEATGLLNNIFETMKTEKKDKWWNKLRT